MRKKNLQIRRRLARVNPSAAFVALATTGLVAPAFGETISTLEAAYTGTNIAASTVGNTGGGDPTAVISSILSSPQTLDGYTYTNWSFLVNDGTGSMDVFGHLPSGNTEPTPTPGDGISATGTYTVFDGIPELETLTALSNTSTGNTVPSPLLVTIPQINATASEQPSKNDGINEYLVTLDNVQIDANGTSNQATGNFPTHANGTYTLSDGTNTITMFQWASSYSVDGALGGTAIPQGPVDITGFADYFSPSAEFVPVSIISVPEPASLGLLALGGLALLKRRSRTA